MSDPTPKLTAECACGRSTPCCSAQAQAFNDLKSLNNAILANQEFHYGEVRLKAFEEAAEAARIAMKGWKVPNRVVVQNAIRALAKEQADG